MLSVERLIWDATNVLHIARHAVNPDDVEQVCQGEHIQAQAYGGRIMLIGRTAHRRMLAIVLDPEPEAGVYYPVTARTASRKERALFHQQRGGIR